MGRFNYKPNGNGTNGNDNADTGPNVQVVPLMAGMGTLLFFVLMAVIVCCLRKRMQRRVALENEQHILNAQLEAQRRKKCRKEHAEALIVTQTLHNGDHELEDGTLLTSSSSSLTPDLSSSSSSRPQIPPETVIGTQCQICHEDFKYGDNISISPNLQCGHHFHKECIIDWLAIKDTCPSCRRDYLNSNEEEHDGDGNSDGNGEGDVDVDHDVALVIRHNEDDLADDDDDRIVVGVVDDADEENLYVVGVVDDVDNNDGNDGNAGNDENLDVDILNDVHRDNLNANIHEDVDEENPCQHLLQTSQQSFHSRLRDDTSSLSS